MKIKILFSKLINKIFYNIKLKHLYYFFHYRYIKYKYKDIEYIKKILNEKKLFLITSTGRTGTVLFSQMLNKINGAYVVHEPLFQETKYHKRAMEDPKFSYNFLKEFRLKEMVYRIEKNNCNRYGEVNGGLRRNIKELKEIFPSMKIIHIVRDGRKIISSVLNRNTFLKGDAYYNLQPSSCIIDTQTWAKFNRFEKITYLWATENKYMRENSDLTIRFEDMVSNYAYFKKNILDVLDLKLNYQDWEKSTQKKVNKTKKTKADTGFEKWSDKQKKFFTLHCSDEMEINGYEIEKKIKS